MDFGDPATWQLKRPAAYISVDRLIYRLGRADLEILTGERLIEPWRGFRTVVFGGYVDPEDESLRTASDREVREETGLETQLAFFVGAYGPARLHHTWNGHRAVPTNVPANVRPTCALVFAARIGGGTLQTSDEQTRFRWCTASALADVPMAFDHALALQDFLSIFGQYDPGAEIALLERFRP